MSDAPPRPEWRDPTMFTSTVNRAQHWLNLALEYKEWGEHLEQQLKEAEVAAEFWKQRCDEWLTTAEEVTKGLKP